MGEERGKGVWRPRGLAGPRAALRYSGSSPAGRLHLPARSLAPARGPDWSQPGLFPLILHPRLGWVGGTGRRVPGSQAAAGSPRCLTLRGSLMASVWVLGLRHF